MKSDFQLFDHAFIDNHAERTLFLLHGTGGSKEDFLFLNQFLGSSYNLVGLRGNVDEAGSARFFRRLHVGVFDQESIQEEVEKLGRFVQAWCVEYQTVPERLTFLGYSNGANILIAGLFRTPQLFQRLVLLHAMLPFTVKPEELNLSTHQLFISLGSNDPLVSPKQQQALIETLTRAKARLTVKEYDGGHEVSPQELEDVLAFLVQSTDKI